MQEHNENPGVLPKDRRDRAALIQDVVQSDGVKPRTPPAHRAELRLGGIIIFDTYVGAAVELFRLGFIDTASLRQASHTCMEEFSAIAPEDFASSEVFETRRAELLRDLKELNTALRESAGISHGRTAPTSDTGASSSSSMGYDAHGGAGLIAEKAASNEEASATTVDSAFTGKEELLEVHGTGSNEVAVGKEEADVSVVREVLAKEDVEGIAVDVAGQPVFGQPVPEAVAENQVEAESSSRSDVVNKESNDEEDESF